LHIGVAFSRPRLIYLY